MFIKRILKGYKTMKKNRKSINPINCLQMEQVKAIEAFFTKVSSDTDIYKICAFICPDCGQMHIVCENKNYVCICGHKFHAIWTSKSYQYDRCEYETHYTLSCQSGTVDGTESQTSHGFLIPLLGDNYVSSPMDIGPEVVDYEELLSVLPHAIKKFCVSYHSFIELPRFFCDDVFYQKMRDEITADKNKKPTVKERIAKFFADRKSDREHRRIINAAYSSSNVSLSSDDKKMLKAIAALAFLS
jgi:hypothetical protein